MSRAKKVKKRLGQIARGMVMAPSLPAVMGVLKANEKITPAYQKTIEMGKPIAKGIKTLIPTKIDDAVIDTALDVQKKTLPKTAKVSGKIANAYGRWVKTGSFKKKKAKKEVDNMSEKTKQISKENDTTWYNNFPELAELAGIPNFTISKDAMKIYSKAYFAEDGIDGTSDVVYYSNVTAIPSIATLNVALTCGRGESEYEYINSINRLMTGLRNALKSNLVYGPEDVFIYVNRIRFIVALYCILRRAYLVSLNYTATDTHEPDSLLKAMGFSPESVRDNRADIRDFLIAIKSQLQTYAALKSDILKRTEWMFSNVFTDDKSLTPQVYLFNLKSIPQLDEGDSSDQGRSFTYFATRTWAYTDFPAKAVGDGKSHPTVLSGWTAQSFMNLLSYTISVFTRNKLTGTISGDMVNAFGAEQLYHLPDVPENGKLQYVYSEEVLNQIQNTIVVDMGNGFSDYVIDSNGEFKYNTLSKPLTTFVRGMQASDEVKLLNGTPLLYYKNNISKLEAIASTRLRPYFQVGSDGTTAELLSYGTEIVSDFSLWSFGIEAGMTDNMEANTNAYSTAFRLKFSNVISFSSFDVVGSTLSNGPKPFMFMEYLLSSFRYLPAYRYSYTIPYRRAANTYTNYDTLTPSVIDYSNIALASLDDIETTHKIANMSLHYYPITFKESKNIRVLKSF